MIDVENKGLGRLPLPETDPMTDVLTAVDRVDRVLPLPYAYRR
jgi:hypothetical protein